MKTEDIEIKDNNSDINEKKNNNSKTKIEIKESKSNINSESTKNSEILKKEDKEVKSNEEKKIKEEHYSPPSMKNLNNNKYDIPKKRHKLLFILIPILIFALLVLILSTVFAIININNDKIISGISIYGINVSDLTKDEAISKINSALDEKINSNITLKHGDFETTVLPSQFEAKFDVTSAVDSAYSIGRNSNIFVNNYTILYTLFSKNDIEPNFTYNDELLTNSLAEINTNLPDAVVESSYYIEDNNLIITAGKDGVAVNIDELKTQIIDSIKCKETVNSIEIPVVESLAKGIDMDGLYQEVHKDPVDAYYTTNPYVVHPHSNGIDFAISLDEAKAMLNEQKNEYIIPLKTLYPNVTTDQIGTEAFPDLLSSFSSKYPTSNTNRATNVRLCTNKINGTVLMPGESFSFNQRVGKRTAAAGYKAATVYVGGKVSQGIGGGICQVSSTLYNAVLLANLEIVERHNHYFNPGYVKAGTDATVSWGGPDFVFKNNRDYPIRIVCSATGGVNSFKIYGLKQDPEYEVPI